jgi:hypothetical protein
MRMHINRRGGKLAPYLLGEIAERLEALNTPQAGIFESRVTLLRQPHGNEMRLTLMLAGKTLHVTRTAATPGAAMPAALHTTTEQLQHFRALRRGGTVARARGSQGGGERIGAEEDA